ncbi:MAG: hypothetical protein IJY28_10490 [Clostridia bacterium]|nr:hypothetical protein [Clostridia bacterium]
MKTFDIQIRDDCAYSALSRSFTAPVCVRCGGICFPEEAWTDFPVAMLCMWTEQLRTILGHYRDPARKVKLFFPDGDYHLECSASGADLHEYDALQAHKQWLRAWLDQSADIGQ